MPHNYLMSQNKRTRRSAKEKRLALWLAFLFCATTALAMGELDFVETNASSGAFPLFDTTPTPIMVEANDWPGVVRAASDLAEDVNRVTGKRPQTFFQPPTGENNVVIIGTLGKSQIIDQLVRAKKIEASVIVGKWESFFLQVVPQPLPGIENALVICGSDKRGTIYGIYDLSEQIGISPWHFWADVPAKHHDKLFVKAGKFVQGPPSVKYRGIFLNDEAPDLSNWIHEKYGNAPGYSGAANYGRGFYTNLFEVMLRLRANYLWPAMWNNAFNAAIMDRVIIGENAEVHDSIIGRHVVVNSSQRKPTKITAVSVIADDVKLEEGCQLSATKIYPHQTIRGEFQNQTIIAN